MCSIDKSIAILLVLKNIAVLKSIEAYTIPLHFWYRDSLHRSIVTRQYRPAYNLITKRRSAGTRRISKCRAAIGLGGPSVHEKVHLPESSLGKLIVEGINTWCINCFLRKLN